MLDLHRTRHRTGIATAFAALTAAFMKPAINVIAVAILASLSLMFTAPAAAAPAPSEPDGATDVGTFANDNPIDWTQVGWFYNHQGDGFPMRVGQNDDVANPGFGRRHIEDKHKIVPPAQDIQAAVADPTGCWYTVLDERWRCYDGLLFVVYSTQIDDRSGDSEPFGIITAYYKLPPGTCGLAATVETMQCEVDPLETSIDYRGPDQVVNGTDLEVSARLGDDLGVPKTNQPLTFNLGTDSRSQTCEGVTSGAGVATCTISNVDQPVTASVPLTIDYAGNTVLQPSSTTVDLALQTPTKIAYTGPEFIANGEQANLAAHLTDYQDNPIADRSVELSLGEGSNTQTCTGTTNSTGDATCVIEAVSQPLNDTATLPASVVFDGDSSYLGSDDAATVKLEYYTGRAFGLQAGIALPRCTSAPPSIDMMDKQDWEHQQDPDGRIRYIMEFLPMAWAGVNTMFTRPAYQFESFGVDGVATVHAITVVHYRGQRCTYRRQIWPTDHPARLAAQMYTTFLEEELNTDTGLNSGRTGAVEI